MDWLEASNFSLNVLKTEFILTGTTWNIFTIGDLLAIRVDHVSLKIKRNLGIMKRVRNDIPKESLISRHRTMVEPYLKFCNNTRGKCSATLISKLQTLQNRAARIVTNATYDNTDRIKLMRQLNWINSLTLMLCH